MICICSAFFLLITQFHFKADSESQYFFLYVKQNLTKMKLWLYTSERMSTVRSHNKFPVDLCHRNSHLMDTKKALSVNWALKREYFVGMVAIVDLHRESVSELSLDLQNSYHSFLFQFSFTLNCTLIRNLRIILFGEQNSTKKNSSLSCEIFFFFRSWI